jgi:hypothetical protein
VKDDPLGKAFGLVSFHRCQVASLLRDQLIPVDNAHPDKVVVTFTRSPGLAAYICEEVAHKLAQVSKNQFIEQSKWPLVSAKLGVNPQSPPWEVALESLPKLSGDFFEKLLSRRSLVNSIRSISRVLKVTMSPELLMQIGVQPNFVQTQRSGELNATDRTVISNLEMPPAFKKLSFLALIQWSTGLYPPSTTKMQLYRIAEIPFIITHYSAEAMQSVYGSLLLPYPCSPSV